MDRRSFVGLGALTVGAALLGCAPLWHVVVQSTPNPLLGQKRFAVLPIDYANLHIGAKTEGQYLSEKEPKQQASFEEDKRALNEKFYSALQARAAAVGVEVVLATGPGAAPFLIRPTVSFIEPGFYVGVASGASRVEMNLKITTPEGQVLDEIELAHGTDSRSGFSIGGISLNPSSGGRLRNDGEALGHMVARYVQLRTGNGE